MIKASIVIPLLNEQDSLKELATWIDSVLTAHEISYEVIFVDDASTDGTRAWLAALTEPNIKVIFNQATLGYAKANNKALALARGEVVGLLNNDLVFTPKWLEPMLDILESPVLKAGIVGNGFVAGQIKTLSSSLPGLSVDTVHNITTSAGGADEEDDALERVFVHGDERVRASVRGHVSVAHVLVGVGERRQGESGAKSGEAVWALQRVPLRGRDDHLEEEGQDG